jgi:energy-converting hydrogenase Eha subunit A
MILALNYTQLFNIIHLCCYIIALILGVYVAMSIDYPKIIKAKSNMNYYVTAFVIGASITFLLGEFLYNIITMFIN